MKIILLSSIIAISLSGCISAESLQKKQDIAYKNSLKTYNEVVELNGFNKKQIFDYSKQWIAQSFNSANSVIQYSNENEGKIIGKGNIKFPCTGYIECSAYANNKIQFTLTIDVKDDKARLSFDDLGIYAPPGVYGGYRMPGGDGLPIWQHKHKPLVTTELKSVVQSYRNGINISKKDNDW